MKKRLLTLAMTMATLAASAQIVIWNGDDKETGSDGGFWKRANPTVVDEDGNKYLKITTQAKTGDWENEHFNFHLPFTADFKGLRRISFCLKMEKGHNVLLKLKHGTAEVSRLFYYNGDETHKNTWQKLNFEFSLGTDNDKVTDSPEGESYLEIWPFEDNDATHAAENVGQVICLDNIQLEGPILKDGAAIRTLADESLTSPQVEITGSLSKGQYQNTWDGAWHMVDYDDYTTVTSKISADVCFLNLTGAAVSDGDSPQLRTKNPNLLILSPKDFKNTDNVIRWDGEKNTTPKMVLTDKCAFYTPIDFHADAVEVTRNLKAGINTLCLPFYVGEAEISSSCKIATYLSSTASAVNFAYADHADANVPFLATAVKADAETLSFTNKGVVTTPDALGTTFVGIYAQQSAENYYGINAEGKFQKGGSSALVNSFRAVLTSVPAAAPAISLIDGDATGINMVRGKGLSVDGAEACYNLQGQRVTKPAKGLYIVNGKKVMFK